MKNAVLLIILFSTLSSYSQFQKTDSIGNFYVIKNKLVWQKYYHLDDIDELDQQLKSNDLTRNLDILNFGTSAITNLLDIPGNNLPLYTKNGFKAFVVIDIKNDNYRVSVKDITFPDFVEERYYNGMRNSTGGTLDYYILRQGETIKRNNATLNVLNSFDTSFSEVFDYMGAPLKE
jgi:hypothetical protein